MVIARVVDAIREENYELAIGLLRQVINVREVLNNEGRRYNSLHVAIIREFVYRPEVRSQLRFQEPL